MQPVFIFIPGETNKTERKRLLDKNRILIKATMATHWKQSLIIVILCMSRSWPSL